MDRPPRFLRSVSCSSEPSTSWHVATARAMRPRVPHGAAHGFKDLRRCCTSEAPASASQCPSTLRSGRARRRSTAAGRRRPRRQSSSDLAVDVRRPAPRQRKRAARSTGSFAEPAAAARKSRASSCSASASACTIRRRERPWVTTTRPQLASTMLAGTAEVEADHRAAERQRLQHDLPAGIVQARKQQQVVRAVDLGDAAECSTQASQSTASSTPRRCA